jgi:hypothetical protein
MLLMSACDLRQVQKRSHLPLNLCPFTKNRCWKCCGVGPLILLRNWSKSPNTTRNTLRFGVVTRGDLAGQIAHEAQLRRRCLVACKSDNGTWVGRLSHAAGPFIICVLALANNQANAQAGATPPPASQQEAVQHPASSNEQPASAPSGASEVCRTLEQAAAENGLPVEFFARVIWQESRFNATAVSAKGAEGIAQFMPQTAGWRGLADPFNPIEALRHSASYLHDLMVQFGNLGLAAAGYNAGPGRVKAWLAGKGGLPTETRNYVAIVTGWTADEWASHSPSQAADATIPPGVPCARLANLVLAPKEEAKRIASYVPRWGIQLAAHLLESKAWEMYRDRQKRYASLIGDHEPVVLYKQIPGMGRAKRYIITIADDDRAPLDKLCRNMIAAGVICDVLRN